MSTCTEFLSTLALVGPLAFAAGIPFGYWLRDRSLGRKYTP